MEKIPGECQEHTAEEEAYPAKSGDINGSVKNQQSEESHQ